MSGYVWVFAMEASGGVVTKLPQQFFIDAQIFSNPPPPIPKPPQPASDEEVAVPDRPQITAIRARDEDFTNLHFYNSQVLTAEEARRFVAEDVVGKKLYENCLNCILYSID